jgi:hypothetical protein
MTITATAVSVLIATLVLSVLPAAVLPNAFALGNSGHSGTGGGGGGGGTAGDLRGCC